MTAGFDSIIYFMKGDIFENKGNNLFSRNAEDDNFFMQEDKSYVQDYVHEPVRRLNDYDFNLLKEDAYKDVTDELFKLEYRISKLEGEYHSIDNQIQAARDISDYDTVEYLINRKNQIYEDLVLLGQIYNEKSLSSRISGGIFNILSPKIRNQLKKVNTIVKSVKDSIISNLPGKFSSVLEIKKSLDKLENISKSVDELMTLQTPYGEAGDKYEQLSRYITRANAIQAQIAKSLR